MKITNKNIAQTNLFKSELIWKTCDKMKITSPCSKNCLNCNNIEIIKTNKENTHTKP